MRNLKEFFCGTGFKTAGNRHRPKQRMRGPGSRLGLLPATRRLVFEQLESRTLLSVGGGYTNAGIMGEYYGSAAALPGTPVSAPYGSPAFTRQDVRIDFNWGTTGQPGGSPDPAYASVSRNNFSVLWSGEVISNFSQTYTFTATTAGGDVLYIRPHGSSTWTTLINDWTVHAAKADSATYALIAGQTYDIQFQYYQPTAGVSTECKLHWSSASTPDEAIEPATAVGVNFESGDGAFANMVNAGTRNYWFVPVNDWNATVPVDSNCWPEGDAELLLGEGDTMTESGGSFLIEFNGAATVSNWPQTAQFWAGGVDYGSSLPAGDGYNSATNTTTATMVLPANEGTGFYLIFQNTSREGHLNTSQNPSGKPDGITNLYVMQPTTLGGSTDPQPGTLFCSAGLGLASQYTTLRLMDFTDTNGNLTSNWSDRTVPGDNFWSGWTFVGGSGVSTGDDATTGAGVPWEVCVALANESGKDVYINVPSNVSIAYIDNLADLFAYGSNGLTPYTSPQTNPVWAPLNSNLKVYIEFSNEIWNSGFAQAGTAASGWCNQLSQRAVYDYLTDNQNDSLYPGGGANAYNDGAIIASQYINSGNEAAWLATYSASPPTVDGRLEYFSNADSSVNGYDIYQGWVALRLEQISTAFKAAFGETGLNANVTASRVRPLLEWQYGGNWSGELGEMQTLFGSQHPVDYYLYGGGGGWYSSDTTDGFTDTEFANCNFAAPVVSGYQQDPTGSSWTFSGTAGIAANGSSMGNPAAPTEGPTNAPNGSSQTAYLQPGASISQSVDFSGGWADITLFATQTSSSYNYGLTISIDGGAAVKLSEGGAGYTGNSSAWGWERTAAFDVTAGYHTVTFTNTSSSGGATVYLDDIGIQTVNGLFNDVAANGTPTITSVQSDVALCLEYGLHDVGYEGGFNFNQNLGYDDSNGYDDMGDKGYSSGTPNVAMEANLDSRTEALAVATIDQFYADGGTLPVVFQSTGNINSWAVAAPTYYNYGTPKQQAAASVEALLPPAATYGTPAPGSISAPSNDWQSVNSKTNEVFLVGLAGTYDVGITIGTTNNGSTGTFQILVDGSLIGSVTVTDYSSSAYSLPASLSLGQHSVEVICTAEHSGPYFGLKLASVVASSPLTFTAQPAASPAMVTATTCRLSTQGQSAAGGITYAWSASLAPTGAAPPAFSANNGTTTGNNTTATFYAAGNYIFTVTMEDSAGNWTAETVSVVVDQTPTTVVVAPSPVVVTAGTQQSFSATLEDQFSNSIPSAAFTWAVTAGGGSVDANGNYTAPGAAGTATLTATSSPGSIKGTAAINVVLPVPAAPTSLTATLISSAEIDLSWPAASGATGYYIYRGTTAGDESAVPLNSSPVTGTTYRDLSVTGQTTYYYVVQAVNATGIGAASPEAAATTPPPPVTFTQNVDIGAPQQAGSEQYATGSGVYTVAGGGGDIWGYADSFHFDALSLAGNGSLVAQVTSIQATSSAAKAGLMFRDSTAANAMMAMLAVTPGAGLMFETRTATGGLASAQLLPGVAAPIWLELSRTGNQFTAYYCTAAVPDGTSWIAIGTPVTVPMSNTALAGLAVTAQAVAGLSTSSFFGLSVSSSSGPQAVPSPDAGILQFTASTNSLRIECDPGNAQDVNVYVDSAASPVVTIPLNEVMQWEVVGGAGGDQLTVDFSNGNPLPAGGLSFAGGTGGAGNQLTVIGKGTADSVTLSPGQLAFDGSPPVVYANVQVLALDLSGGHCAVAGAMTGNTSLVVGGSGSVTAAAGFTQAGLVTVASGTLVIGDSANLASGVNITVGADTAAFDDSSAVAAMSKSPAAAASIISPPAPRSTLPLRVNLPGPVKVNDFPLPLTPPESVSESRRSTR